MQQNNIESIQSDLLPRLMNLRLTLFTLLCIARRKATERTQEQSRARSGADFAENRFSFSTLREPKSVPHTKKRYDSWSTHKHAANRSRREGTKRRNNGPTHKIGIYVCGVASLPSARAHFPFSSDVDVDVMFQHMAPGGVFTGEHEGCQVVFSDI